MCIFCVLATVIGAVRCVLDGRADGCMAYGFRIFVRKEGNGLVGVESRFQAMERLSILQD